MMVRKTLYLLLSALTIFFGAGCTRENTPKEGSVVLTFSTGKVLTKSGVADGDSIAFDNGKPDIFLAIANARDEVVATYPGAKSQLLENALPTQLAIKFTDFRDNGEYTVYAAANTNGGVLGAPADTNAWKAITRASDLDALRFAELQGDAIPVVNSSTGRMPLSAKGILSVNENLNGHAEIELQRCLAKVAFKFKNETPDTLTLTNCRVTIREINPTQGYIFPQAVDTVGVARNLTLISSTLDPIPNGSETGFYGDKLVFPSLAPARTIGSRYFCDISFTVGGVSKTFTDLPIHDRQSNDILSLNRNQYLQIETRINRGLNVSFNFVVHDYDWDENEVTEEIIFH